LIAHLGLRRSVVAGVCIAAIILLSMPLRTSLPVWLTLRTLTGCALGLSWIASEVWLGSVAGPKLRGTIMGLYGTVFSCGAMAGPALLEFTGTRGWRPFAVGATALTLTLLPLLLLGKGVTAEPQFTPLREFAAVLRRAPVVMWAALIAGLIESADLTLLPLFGVRSGLRDGAALLLLTVYMGGNVVLQTPIGLLADRWGRRRSLAACAALSGVGPLLLMPWLHTPLLLWPLLFVWGGTLYAFYSQGIALLGGAFAEAELATANTVFVMVYCLGGVLGPSVGGVAMDAWPTLGLQVVLSVAAFSLLGALLPCTMKAGVTDGRNQL
jgi:MFS family permease